MPRIPCILLCGVLLLALTGCGLAPASDLPTVSPSPAEADSDSTESIQDDTYSAQVLLEDYDALWEALETDYPFLPLLEDQGIDVQRFRHSYRHELQGQEMSLEEFYSFLSRLMAEFQSLGHLSLVDPGTYEIYRGYLSDQAPYASVLAAPHVAESYARLSAARERTTTAGTYAADLSPIASYAPERREVYFHFYTFNVNREQEDQNFVTDYLSSLGDAPIDNILFDITGNGGGSTTYWQNVIAAPFGGDYRYDVRLYLRDTPRARSYISEPLHAISELSDTEVPDFAEPLGLSLYISSEVQVSGAPTASGDALTARRWLLVDDQVYSAADSFTAFCKATGWATVVGTNTLGDGMGFSPAIVNLPNTGLLIRFSITAAQSIGGGLNVMEGTAPDYRCGRYESPISAVRRLIDADK